MRGPAIFRDTFGLTAAVVALVALGAAVNQLCRHRTEGAAIREYDGWDLLESDSVRREVSLLRQREARRARQAEAIAQARETGREVEVERWTEACDGSVDECSIDVCVRSARPDGTLFFARIHSF